jgi:hypothetical protein
MKLDADKLCNICLHTETNKPVILKIGRKITYLTNPIHMTTNDNPFHARCISVGLTSEKDKALLSHDLGKAIVDFISDTNMSYYTTIVIGDTNGRLPGDHVSETETALIIENDDPEFNTMAEIYTILQDSDIRDERGWQNMDHTHDAILITDKFGREFSVTIKYKH